MRPFTRREELKDLAVARRLVSAAERQALERAEELRRRAEELLEDLDSAAQPPEPVQPPEPAGPVGPAAVREVEELLRAAVAAAERETVRAAAARDEAEGIRRQALEDADRIRAEARRLLDEHMAGLQALLDDGPGPGKPDLTGSDGHGFPVEQDPRNG